MSLGNAGKRIGGRLSLYKGKAGGGGSVITPRTAAFLAATGITDPTIISALNTLDLALIAAGLLPAGTGAGVIKQLYPFVGGTASTNKYNFIDPQDADSSFRITWSGGITHNSNGVTGNGVNGYGNLHIKPDPDVQLNSVGVSYLCSNTGVDGNILFGCYTVSTSSSRFFHFPAFSVANTTQTQFNSASASTIATPRQGFHTVQRISSTIQNNYRNGSLVGSTNTNVQIRNILDCYFLCVNIDGVPATYNASNIRILIFHTFLDATQAAALYNANVSFQTILGRNV